MPPVRTRTVSRKPLTLLAAGLVLAVLVAAGVIIGTTVAAPGKPSPDARREPPAHPR
jgi:hypothetical protein